MAAIGEHSELADETRVHRWGSIWHLDEKINMM